MSVILSECQSHLRVGSEAEDRPERMRDWLIRVINSGRFAGLEWLDDAKTIFRVPWIHAKKRGYCKERDAALFREWAVHSGKYRDEGDPTVWKINFRCAINGLKDILEMKDLQTEDCRIYKVLPSRSRRGQRKQRSRFPTTEPYCYPLQGTIAPPILFRFLKQNKTSFIRERNFYRDATCPHLLLLLFSNSFAKNVGF